MKFLFIFFFIGFISLTNAQTTTIEDEISTKSCECIQQKLQEKHAINKDDTDKCIGESLDKVLKAKPEKEAKKYMKNMQLFYKKS